MAKNPSGRQEYQMAKALDRLKAFEEFERTVPPMIRADLSSGLSADEIYAKYDNYAAARAVAIALMEADSGKALAAIRDIRDRTQGKAVERKELTHRLDKLPDKELDALLLTEMSDIEDGKKS